MTKISIHAPRAGSDVIEQIFIPHRTKFQSTLPVRGATLSQTAGRISSLLFQSTLPVRGATSGILSNEEFEENFNPRSPCGERLAVF